MTDSNRFCYWVNPVQDPDEHGGYVPSCVKEGVSGHFPMTGKGDCSAPWVWGKTYEQAVEICESMNRNKLELSRKEVDKIIASSMMAKS